MQEKYKIQSPESWVDTTSNQDLIEKLVDTPFSESQIDQGKDFCYFFKKIYHTSEQSNSDYLLMAYSLNQPDTLKWASVSEQILEENEMYFLHRISVFRNGELIDKIPDTTFKIIDNEDQSGWWVINNFKKINITIKDLRLYDIIIIEDTRTKTFTPKDILRKAFYRNILITPNVYWAYAKYDIEIINNRNTPISYKKNFFRDENGNRLPSEIWIIMPNSNYHIEWTQYYNNVDTKREEYPYFDFSTQADWNSLSNFIVPYIENVMEENKLTDFAPDFIEELNKFENKKDQIAFAIEYIQNQIQYIYNANEMHDHIPQSPKITFENKQGDCKAKSALLKIILDYLEVPCDIILVNFQADIYMTHYLPSLLSFNHAIVKITFDNKDYFIDPTIRDGYGHLENRDVDWFLYYFSLKKDQKLEMRPTFIFPDYSVDQKVDIDVEKNFWKIKVSTTYRFNRANDTRKYFKNTNKREIIDGWNNYMFYALNYHNNSESEDIRNIFKNAQIKIVSDDTKKNEFSIEYTSEVENIYFTDKQGKRFLMFFNGSVLKNITDYNHKDFLYWHNFEKERYEFNLYTDENIDTNEKYTKQECDIKNKYFTYSLKKSIKQNGGSAYIEYNPISNVEVLSEDLEALKKDYEKIADSNYGIWIDIIEKWLLNKLKFALKGMF